MLAELNTAEQDWMRGNLGALIELGIRLDPESLQALFDEQLAAWRAIPVEQRYDPTPVITVIGIGLGEYVRHHTGLVWMVDHRHGGAELALASDHEDLAAQYPTTEIGDRWHTGERDFLPRLSAAMIDEVWRAKSRSLA